MALGFIIQKSMRYLLGDHHYRHYFPLFTAITSFASLTSMFEEFKTDGICWGMTLLCLTLLMNVNRFWKVPRESAEIIKHDIFMWLACIRWSNCNYLYCDWRVARASTSV